MKGYYCVIMLASPFLDVKKKYPLISCFNGSAIFCDMNDEHFYNLLFRVMQKNWY